MYNSYSLIYNNIAILDTYIFYTLNIKKRKNRYLKIFSNKFHEKKDLIMHKMYLL